MELFHKQFKLVLPQGRVLVMYFNQLGLAIPLGRVLVMYFNQFGLATPLGRVLEIFQKKRWMVAFFIIELYGMSVKLLKMET